MNKFSGNKGEVLIKVYGHKIVYRPSATVVLKLFDLLQELIVTCAKHIIDLLIICRTKHLSNGSDLIVASVDCKILTAAKDAT